MFTFIIHYFDEFGNQSHIITASSRQNYEHQLTNFLKLHNLTIEQVTVECLSKML